MDTPYNDHSDSNAHRDTSHRTPFRAILLHGFTNEEALQIMRAVKALGSPMKDAAFAMTTPTSLAWKVETWVAELEEEHRMMQQYQRGGKPAGS